MALRWTEEEYQAYLRGRGNDLIRPAFGGPPSPEGEGKGTPKKRQKYGNVRVEMDGKKFDSRHEAEVYRDLMLRRRAGELRLVLRQVSFALPGGIRYVADFVTVDYAGNVEVIDAKSEATRQNRVYINKRKQMKSEWDIEIKEA